MKIKELKKFLSDERISQIMFIKRQIRDIRILVSDARKMKHRVSQDALYNRALSLMNHYFGGKLFVKSTIDDRLTWPRDVRNDVLRAKMNLQQTPKIYIVSK